MMPRASFQIEKEISRLSAAPQGTDSEYRGATVEPVLAILAVAEAKGSSTGVRRSNRMALKGAFPERLPADKSCLPINTGFTMPVLKFALLYDLRHKFVCPWSSPQRRRDGLHSKLRNRTEEQSPGLHFCQFSSRQ